MDSIEKELRELNITSIESSWDLTKLDLLLLAIKNEFKKSFEEEHILDVEFDSLTESFIFKITTSNFGFIKTSLSKNYIYSKDIPKDFPKIFVKQCNEAFKEKKIKILNILENEKKEQLKIKQKEKREKDAILKRRKQLKEQKDKLNKKEQEQPLLSNKIITKGQK